jgi:hypothetical protein
MPYYVPAYQPFVFNYCYGPTYQVPIFQPPVVHVQVQPLPQPLVQRTAVPTPTFHVNRGHPREMSPPEPIRYCHPELGDFGLRCVCGKRGIDGLLIQCSGCDYRLHGSCVNIAREMKGEPYLCPFCVSKRILCVCNNSRKYSEPLIQCSRCKLWSHKACQHLEFGRNPDGFICHACNPADQKYELEYVRFEIANSSIPDTTVIVDCDPLHLLINIPEGLFRSYVSEDLNHSQLNFRATVERYFHAFAPVLFDRSHDFWVIFVDTLSTMLACSKTLLLLAVDTLASQLLYSPSTTRRLQLVKFGHSESITRFLESHVMPRIEHFPKPVRIYVDSRENNVKTNVGLEDGAFITDLPGFMEHTDEVGCEGGIPKTCLAVTDADVVVDMEGTACTFARHIRRGFHFNCIVKLVRVESEARVALYATKLKGPLSDEKMRKGIVIPENGELILPFDGEIPFPVEKVEWKTKRRNSKRMIQSVTSFRPEHSPFRDNFCNKETEKGRERVRLREKEVKPKKLNQRIKSGVNPEFNPESPITLLSGFLLDEIPVLPFVLLPDRDAVDRYHSQQVQKARVRGYKSQMDYV